MNQQIRVATASNKISIGSPKSSADAILSVIQGLCDVNPDILLFPLGALTGGQCGDLLKNPTIIDECEAALLKVANATKKLNCIILIGTTVMINKYPQTAVAVLCCGEILKMLVKGSCDVFMVGSGTFSVYFDGIESLPLNLERLLKQGTDLILIPSYTGATALSVEHDIATYKTISEWTASAVAVTNGGIGDTSFPLISKGYAGIFECGNTAAFSQSFDTSCVSVFDIDLDIIQSTKQNMKLPFFNGEVTTSISSNPKTFMMRTLDTMPYLPSQKLKQAAYLDDLFKLQSAALARRTQNIGVKKLIIGVSGGLDSTLALLVAACTCDMLKLPRKNIVAVTMKGMGTSTTTYDNAHLLMSQIGTTILDIPIKSAVLSHLEQIGHPADLYDVTYENAQARERTQILFDLANMNGGIVVGTGDLSESALGFCTFGGDQLASFNVNNCLTKTVIRMLVERLAQTIFVNSAKVLTEILNTPISPELLPTDELGEISQKTEEILGEYELHDFFLYYFIKYNFCPQKLLEFATVAFIQKYTADYIKEKLQIFLKRFISSQFKRSTAIDSAAITEVNLNFHSIPSDIGTSSILSDTI